MDAMMGREPSRGGPYGYDPSLTISRARVSVRLASPCAGS